MYNVNIKNKIFKNLFSSGLGTILVCLNIDLEDKKKEQKCWIIFMLFEPSNKKLFHVIWRVKLILFT